MESAQAVRTASKIGNRRYPHAAALDKVLFSGMADEQIAQLLRVKGTPHLTPKTLIKPSAILAAIRLVRERRFAVDDEENEPGGMRVASGRIFEIAPENPCTWVWEEQPGAFVPKEKAIPPGPVQSWRFPPTSVTVVELNLVPA